MAIDITAETLITPKQYTRMRPPGRNGRPMHISTFYRHMADGLEFVKIGGNVYTSIEAVKRFVERSTLARSGSSAVIPPATPAARRRAVDQADRELTKLGV
jgi:hypothetical protein